MSESEVRDRIIAEATATLDQGGPQPWAAEMGLKLGPNDEPEWCGIWARAIWRRSGLTVRSWKVSDGNTSGLVRVALPMAQHGDLVCWKGKGGHQSLFWRLEGNVVVTIDGNTTKLDDHGNVAFEVVAIRKRPASQVLMVCRAPIPGEA